MESELPIPMPEIPGYKPPEKQDRKSESSPPRSMASAPSVYNSIYDEGMRRRPIPLARPRQPAWQQTYQDWYNYYAMLQSYPVISQPYVNAMYGIIPNSPVTHIDSYFYNNQYTPTPPLQVSLPPRPKTPPREQKHQTLEEKEKNSKPEWLECQVKDDAFGLVGEILLCPIKVTICILQELFRKNE